MLFLAFKIACVIVLVSLFIPVIVWLCHMALASIGLSFGGLAWLVGKFGNGLDKVASGAIRVFSGGSVELVRDAESGQLVERHK